MGSARFAGCLYISHVHIQCTHDMHTVCVSPCFLHMHIAVFCFPHIHGFYMGFRTCVHTQGWAGPEFGLESLQRAWRVREVLGGKYRSFHAPDETVFFDLAEAKYYGNLSRLERCVWVGGWVWVGGCCLCMCVVHGNLSCFEQFSFSHSLSLARSHSVRATTSGSFNDVCVCMYACVLARARTRTPVCLYMQTCVCMYPA